MISSRRMAGRCWHVFALLALAVGSGCQTPDAAKAKGPPAPILLISLDAFRWDYCALHPAETPNLHQLMRDGVSARALIPVFPSQTFASHYSIVTGLYPAHHGIIGNRFFDPTLGLFFHYKLPNSLHDPRIWGGEPIWATAVKQGRKSACYFWAGSEVVNDARPTYSKAYDYSIPFEKRLDELMGWLQLPDSQRPAVTTFYFEETNTTGHYRGPEAPETIAAIKLLDEHIGEIMSRLRAAGIAVNLIVVSDHGMAATDGAHQTAMLDDYLDLKGVQVDFDGPITGIRTLNGNPARIVEQLSKLPPQYHVYRAEALPARWHLTANPRIPDIWVVPDPGWRLQQRANYVATKDERLKGDHGYDNASPLMHGILIAHGPAFKAGGMVIEPEENIHLYNLMCAVAGLKPAANDGDDRLVRTMLRK